MMSNFGWWAIRHVKVSPGESVRILHELQKKSQNELAAASRIPQSTTSATECERIQSGVEKAKRFARLLRCLPAVLVFLGWNINSEVAA
jgi:hypothetical protein